VETIDPRSLAPWRTLAFTEIDIKPDHEKAKEKTSIRQAGTGVTVFSNASGQYNNLGTAAVTLDKNQNIIQHYKICIISMEYSS
jgi:hypothetical protein